MNSMFKVPYFLNQNGLVGHLNIVLAPLKLQSLLKIIIHHIMKMLKELTLLHFSFLKTEQTKSPKPKSPTPTSISIKPQHPVNHILKQSQIENSA